MKHLLLLTYLISFSLPSQNNVYEFNNSSEKLYKYAEFSNVGNQNLNISEVIKNSTLEYTPLLSNNHSLGFTSDNYWLRFKIKNNEPRIKTYYLETARPITDIVNLYQIGKDKIEHFKSGDKIPFNEKQVKHRSSIFKITLPPNEVQQLYIHYQSDGETINLPLKLYDESSFWMSTYKQQLFLGLFYGLLFLASIIYLFFYSSLREKAFLYYGLYVFSIGVMQATLDGFTNQFILPNSGFLSDRAVLIAALSTNFFLLKYCEHFLRINNALKGFTKGFNIIYGITVALFIFIFINEKTLELAYPLCNINGFFSLLLILTTLFAMRFKRIKIDPYFSFGILFLVIALLGFVMNNLSILPNNFFTLNSAKLGSGFEVIFLSLSMTDLLRQLREEKEKSQEEALLKSQEISALKTHFMSNMSHELRTPINAIMGVTEDALETTKGKKKRKAFNIIKNASLSLLSNVNDIMDFERIEKNELKLELSVFDPLKKLNQISNNWKIEAEKKGLDYTFEIDSEIPSYIEADPARFIQIVNNVLANAVKYTKTGSIYFKLSCIKKADDLCVFSFKISDTGIGMSAQAKNSVFDSFNQMKLNHKRQYGGIGLGLTIVKHVIELFDGSIKIESELKKGTDVYIEITTKRITTKKEIVNISEIKNMLLHILVVEDNKLNQLVMSKILKTVPQITFKIVNNGKEAIEALGTKTYDVILMDLQMPVMDGYEATEMIRSGQLKFVNSNIPIIAVTADVTQETQKKIFNLGINAYVAKPVNKSFLFEKIYSFDFENNNNKESKTLRIA